MNAKGIDRDSEQFYADMRAKHRQERREILMEALTVIGSIVAVGILLWMVK